jgi:hypothetical protein
MGEETMDPAADDTAEALLAGALTREALALAAVVPVLRHLLGCETPALLSDAILARVRGMIADLAAQLLGVAAGRDPALRLPAAADDLDSLTERLMADEALLAHCHALAAEGLIAERLQQRSAIDPVLSPLLQELIAAEDPAVASLAMSTLAAQSRFVQSQRRMELPLGELPAELFHRLVASLPDGAGRGRLQAGYDEAVSRIGLLARLVAAMRRGALAALALDHAGIALFASALADAARQPRAGVVLACHEGQGMRLGLLLRAAGQGAAAIERQLGLVGPAAHLPPALAALTPARAAALLADGGAGA